MRRVRWGCILRLTFVAEPRHELAQRRRVHVLEEPLDEATLNVYDLATNDDHVFSSAFPARSVGLTELFGETPRELEPPSRLRVTFPKLHFEFGLRARARRAQRLATW